MGRFSPQRYYDDPEGYFKKFRHNMGVYIGKRWSALPEKVQQLIYKSCEGDASEAYYDLERMYEDAAKMCINTPIAFPVFLTLLKLFDKEQDPDKVAKIDEVLSCYEEVKHSKEHEAKLRMYIAMVREIVSCINDYWEEVDVSGDSWDGGWAEGHGDLLQAEAGIALVLWRDVLEGQAGSDVCKEVASIIVDYARHLAQGN